MGTVFAAVIAADFNSIFVIIVLLLSIPSMVSCYALHLILGYLARE